MSEIGTSQPGSGRIVVERCFVAQISGVCSLLALVSVGKRVIQIADSPVFFVRDVCRIYEVAAAVRIV